MANNSAENIHNFENYSILKRKYEEEKEKQKIKFIDNLFSFYESRGNDQVTLSDKNMRFFDGSIPDVSLLFNEVAAMGGLEKVSSNSEVWKSITLFRNIMDTHINDDFKMITVRNYYYILLFPYERFTKTNVRLVNAVHGNFSNAMNHEKRSSSINDKKKKVMQRPVREDEAGYMRRILVALDSEIEREVMWGLKALTVISYSPLSGLPTPNVPGVLEIINRMLDSCRTTIDPSPNTFFLSEPEKYNQKHTQASYLLNIIRNFSTVIYNVSYLTTHPDTMLNVLLFLNSSSHVLSFISLEILSYLAREIDLDGVAVIYKEKEAQIKQLFPYILSITEYFLISSEKSHQVVATEVIFSLTHLDSNEPYLCKLSNHSISQICSLLVSSSSSTPLLLSENDNRDTSLHTLYRLADLSLHLKVLIANQPGVLAILIKFISLTDMTENGISITAARLLRSLADAPANRAPFSLIQNEVLYLASTNIHLAESLFNIVNELNY